MTNKDTLHREAVELLKRASPPERTAKEAVIAHMLEAGMHPEDHLELRLTDPRGRDYFALAQRGVNAFCTAFHLYPTSVVLHPTVAALLIHDGRALKAEHYGGEEYMTILFGRDFTPTAIAITADTSLALEVVVVRFHIEIADYEQEILHHFQQRFKDAKRGGW
jgi:hypothetical protein